MIPYIQSTQYTTAAASLLNLLELLNPKFIATAEKELSLWQYAALLPTRACCIFSLASYAQKSGFTPQVIVENENYSFPDYRFYRYTKEDIDCAEKIAQRHLQRAKQHNVPITERSISFGEIPTLLKQGAKILLRLNVKEIRGLKRNSSNYLALSGIKNDQVSLIDPAKGAITVPLSVIKDAFETLETKKHRDHRMIVFS